MNAAEAKPDPAGERVPPRWHEAALSVLRRTEQVLTLTRPLPQGGEAVELRMEVIVRSGMRYLRAG